MARLRSLRAARSAAAATGVSGLVAAAGACSIMITDNLPPYSCLPDGDKAPICPGAQVCAPARDGLFQCLDRCTDSVCSGFCDHDSGWCVAVNDAGTGED